MKTPTNIPVTCLLAILCVANSPHILAQTPAAGDTTGERAAPSDEGNNASDLVVLGEFVVTGTLIRGVAPVGANVISIEPAKAASTGATNASQLLASVPQVGNLFNAYTTINTAAAAQQQTVRPNLRNLPGGGFATGAATLVLINGHRVAAVGVSTSAIDPDLVPLGAIESVEIMTDGGSSLYGADAVGGVINFISRRRFDGIQIDGRYGFADAHYTVDTNLTVGKDWGAGSAYLSYNYAKHDALLGSDRDYVKRVDWSTNPPTLTGRQTDVPNIQAGGLPQFGIPGTSYAMPDLIPNTFNSVDVLQNSSILPNVERHGVFGSLTQDLTDTIKVDIRGFYAKRDTLAPAGPHGASVSVGATNPFYVSLPDQPTATQQVSFNFGPLLGYHSLYQTTGFEEWGANALLKADLKNDWQLRTLVNYSESNSDYFLNGINPTQINTYAAGTTTTTAINPYNIGSTPNRQLIDDIIDWETAGESKNQLLNLRATLDGRVMTVPGGDLRLAVGYEFIDDDFAQRFGSQRIGGVSALAFESYNRKVHSWFGEVRLPIFEEKSAVAGIRSLVLTAAGRYDDYSDFGHTTNPKLGATYKPVEWITIRGNWGKSFNAPTLVDQMGSRRNTLTILPFVIISKPDDPPAPGSWLIALQGSMANLKPQTADTWSAGLDIDVPGVSGLRASVSFYHIFFEGILNKAPVTNVQQLLTYFPEFITFRPTSEQIAAYGEFAAHTGGPAQVAQFLDGVPPVYQLIDFRTANLGNTKLDGLDAAISYTVRTEFGQVDASVSGNYQLNRETQLNSLSPFSDDLETGESLYSMQATFGATFRRFRAQTTWKRRGGYDVTRSAILLQDHVSAFDTIDLFFRYDLNAEKLFSNLSLTLNVNNVFDQEPPILRDSGGSGFTNGFTVGRLVMFGVSKKF